MCVKEMELFDADGLADHFAINYFEAKHYKKLIALNSQGFQVQPIKIK